MRASHQHICAIKLETIAHLWECGLLRYTQIPSRLKILLALSRTLGFYWFASAKLSQSRRFRSVHLSGSEPQWITRSWRRHIAYYYDSQLNMLPTGNVVTFLDEMKLTIGPGSSRRRFIDEVHCC
jgi:hypothetical protein